MGNPWSLNLFRGLLGPVLVLGLSVVLFAPAAVAHNDVMVAQGTHEVPAGESIALPAEIHYHRLIGTVQADPETDLEVFVVGPDGQEQRAAGPGSNLRVDHLVVCCEDAVWTPHTVVVKNEGGQDAQVAIHLVFLHDGFAVIALDAEPAAAFTTILMPLLIAGVCLYRLRRPPIPTDQERHGRQWSRAAIVLFAAMVTVTAIFSLWGMIRYGSGPVVGTLTATADLPVTGWEVTNHTFLFGAMILIWGAMIGTWTGALRRTSDTTGRMRLAWTGFAMAASSVAMGALWALEYRLLLVPLLLAVAAAAFPLAVAIRIVRPRKTGAVTPLAPS